MAGTPYSLKRKKNVMDLEQKRERKTTRIRKRGVETK